MIHYFDCKYLKVLSTNIVKMSIEQNVKVAYFNKS